MHLDTKRVESTGILRADHARPHQRESFWEQADLKDLVGIMHTGCSNGNSGGRTGDEPVAMRILSPRSNVSGAT
jgi:hypothetical protein